MTARVLRACALAIGLALVTMATSTSVAAATRWQTCHFEASGGVGTSLARIVLEPFEVMAPGGGSAAIVSFEEDPGVASVVPGYERFISSTYTCDAYDTREAAQAKADRWKGSSNYAIIRAVQWDPPASVSGLGGAKKQAAVSDVAVTPKAGPNAAETVVKADTGVRDAAAAWDELARKVLANEAQRNVLTAARNALADHERQAEIRKFFDERRRQGRAQ